MAKRRLPQLGFAPIVATPNFIPNEEFAATRDVLLNNYNEALDNLSVYEQSKASLRAAPFEADQQLFDDTLKGFDNRFSSIQDRDDYENQLTATKRLLSDFSKAAIPLSQRFQDSEKLRQEILADKNIFNKQQALNAVNAIENLDPSFEVLDDGSVANKFNRSRFDPIFTSDVNVAEKLDEFTKGIEANLQSEMGITSLTGGEPTSLINILENSTTESVTGDRVKNIVKNFISSDIDIQNALNKEEFFRDLERKSGQQIINPNEGIESQIEAVTEAIIGKRAYERIRSTGSALSSNSEGGIDRTPSGALIIGNSPGLLMHTPEAYNGIAEKIKDIEFEVSQMDENDPRREALQEEIDNYNGIKNSIISKIKGDLENDEKELIFKHINIKEEELDQIISNALLLTSGSYLETSVGIESNTELAEMFDLRKARNKLDGNIEDILKENPPVTVAFDTYLSEGDGKYSTVTGAISDIGLNAVNSAGYSIAKDYTNKKGENLQAHLNDNFIDIKVPNLDGNWTYTGKFDLVPSNGIDLDKNPLETLIVYGKPSNDEDGPEQPIATLNVTRGNAGWSTFQDAARDAYSNASNDIEQVAAQKGIVRSSPTYNNGPRIGQVSAGTNLYSIPDGGKKTLFTLPDTHPKVPGGKLKVEKSNDRFSIVVLDKDKNEISRTPEFTSQDEFETQLYQMFISKQ